MDLKGNLICPACLGANRGGSSWYLTGLEKNFFKLHLVRQVYPENALNNSSVTLQKFLMLKVLEYCAWTEPPDEVHIMYICEWSTDAFCLNVPKPSLCKTSKTVLRCLCCHEKIDVGINGDEC